MGPFGKLLVLIACAAVAAWPLVAAHAQDSTTVPTRTDSAATRTLTPAQLADARRAGEAVAAKQGGWFGRSYVVGLVSSVIGGSVVVAIAATNEPLPPKAERLRIMPYGEAYERAFEQGYVSKMRRKRVWTSVAGVLLGTATIIGAWLASESGEFIELPSNPAAAPPARDLTPPRALSPPLLPR